MQKSEVKLAKNDETTSEDVKTKENRDLLIPCLHFTSRKHRFQEENESPGQRTSYRPTWNKNQVFLFSSRCFRSCITDFQEKQTYNLTFIISNFLYYKCQDTQI